MKCLHQHQQTLGCFTDHILQSVFMPVLHTVHFYGAELISNLRLHRSVWFRTISYYLCTLTHGCWTIGLFLAQKALTLALQGMLVLFLPVTDWMVNLKLTWTVDLHFRDSCEVIDWSCYKYQLSRWQKITVYISVWISRSSNWISDNTVWWSITYGVLQLYTQSSQRKFTRKWREKQTCL